MSNPLIKDFISIPPQNKRELKSALLVSVFIFFMR
jgi:hypothetical protein